MRSIQAVVISIQGITADLGHGVSVDRQNADLTALLVKYHYCNGVCPAFVPILLAGLQDSLFVDPCVQDGLHKGIVAVFLTFVGKLPKTVSHIMGIAGPDLHGCLLLLIPVCKKPKCRCCRKTDNCGNCCPFFVVQQPVTDPSV